MLTHHGHKFEFSRHMNEELGEQPLIFSKMIPRSLAGGGGDLKIDYTVFSVVVWTLGLILFLEAARHYIDRSSKRRPFFAALLDMLYRELSTLGMVEFAIFLAFKFAKNLNLAVEQAFALVHFTLFFVAIINALQSSLVAIIAMKIAESAWVKTEELQASHYVAIRKEFVRVDEKLRGIKERLSSAQNSDQNSNACFRSSLYMKKAPINAFDPSLYSYKNMFRDLKLRFKCPALKKRHTQLLVQVRFHELRAQFIDSNDLPQKFKVAEYLKHSQIHILNKFLHISHSAWLTALGGANLLYFFCGITVDVTNEVSAASTFISAASTVWCIACVFTTLLISRGVSTIFVGVMNVTMTENKIKKGTHYKESNKNGSKSVMPQKSFKKNLVDFVGKDSYLSLGLNRNMESVPAILQFMQFGYAIIGASLFVFSDFLQLSKDHPIKSGLVIIVLVPSYFCFLLTVGTIMPRYTLCMSLGDRVDTDRLNESVAVYKLEKARRQAEIRCDDKKFNDAQKLKTDVQIADMVNLGLEELPEINESEALTTRTSILKRVGAPPRRYTKIPEQHNTNSATPNELSDGDLPSIECVNDTKTQAVVPFVDKVRLYYISSNYNIFSNILLCNVCLFFVGMRVEMLLLATDVLPDIGATVHMESLGSLFWTLICLFAFNVVDSIVALSLFAPRSISSIDREARLRFLIASAMNLYLNILCIGLLFGAESQRCCEEKSVKHNRVLGGEVDDYHTGEYGPYPDDHDYGRGGGLIDPDNCCPSFGSRWYGGVGHIEPFTCLIALSRLRNLFAKKIYRALLKPSHNTLRNSTNNHDHNKTGASDAVNMLWYNTVIENPDVAKKYGEVSVEILQAMLGIKVDMSREPVIDLSQDKSTKNVSTLDENLKRKFPNLKSAARAVVMAGKLGRPMVSSRNLLGDTIHHDSDKEREEENDDSISSIGYLDARLVRSMRRAEIRFPPLIHEWTSVDVLLTKYELVYLESIDFDSLTEQTPDESNNTNDVTGQRIRYGREALAATNGGKGLRLRDVIAGRHVLGNLYLNKIDSIFIQQMMPAQMEGVNEDLSGFQGEYWTSRESGPSPTMESKIWAKIIEDRLCLNVSRSQSLYLRFFVDITTETNMRTGARKWALTIARTLGPSKLKQKLPHLGSGDHDEISDFLLVEHRTLENGPTLPRRQLFGRAKSRKSIYIPGNNTRSSYDDPV